MITSGQNPKIKRIRALLAARQDRAREKVYIIEGVRLVEEAVKAGVKPELVLFSSDLSPRGRDMLENFAAAGTQVEEVEAT
ncbi:MAG: TrmH family RNA methyltransferase, partial [Bellilinea sp.]